ncbi:hypothetical protein [Rodentibacter ratti]|nr:hypothetical protein [Rodentibacter ratti]CRY96226.1 hypothetical protein [uncultured prokaryote]
MSSESFYDPMSALYDSGCDYITREKHRLVAISQSAWNTLLRLSCDYDFFVEKEQMPFVKDEIDLDMKTVSKLKEKFKNFNEVQNGNGDWVYQYSYDEGIKELDEVLLKYSLWLDNLPK